MAKGKFYNEGGRYRRSHELLPEERARLYISEETRAQWRRQRRISNTFGCLMILSTVVIIVGAATGSGVMVVISAIAFLIFMVGFGRSAR